MLPIDPRTRARACLLAGAVGDAWGGPYENQPPQPTTPPYPSNPRLSDDTLLTLATCESIAMANGEAIPEHLAARFRAWFDQGRLTGLGSSTLAALRALHVGAHWALAGARGDFAAGAGAAMRAAPLAFVLDPTHASDRQTIHDVCRITHHNEEAHAAALAIVVAIRTCATRPRVPTDLLAHTAAELPDTAVRDRILELSRTAATPFEVAARYGTTGHAVDAVPLALHIAVHARDSVERAARIAVALGGDTDTVAALAAQIVGASGQAPPETLWRPLANGTDLTRILDDFTGIL